MKGCRRRPVEPDVTETSKQVSNTSATQQTRNSKLGGEKKKKKGERWGEKEETKRCEREKNHCRTWACGRTKHGGSQRNCEGHKKKRGREYGEKGGGQNGNRNEKMLYKGPTSAGQGTADGPKETQGNKPRQNSKTQQRKTTNEVKKSGLRRGSDMKKGISRADKKNKREHQIAGGKRHPRR